MRLGATGRGTPPRGASAHRAILNLSCPPGDSATMRPNVMRLTRQAVGRLGERLAERHLLDQGARLLERNYHIQYGEIDLLFEDGDELVAVEVKTRDVEDFVQPEETIRWSQLRRIERAM